MKHAKQCGVIIEEFWSDSKSGRLEYFV